MDCKLISVENTESLRNDLADNIAQAYSVLGMRESFLVLAKDMITQKNECFAGLDDNGLSEVLSFIEYEGLLRIEEAKSELVNFGLTVQQMLGIEKMEFPQACEPYNKEMFEGKQGKELKERLKMAVIKNRSYARTVVKKAQKLLHTRELALASNTDEEKELEYNDSFNFRYLLNINAIFAKSSADSKLVDMLVEQISLSKSNKPQEMGE